MADEDVDSQELHELNASIAELYEFIGQNWKDIGSLGLARSEVLGIKLNTVTLPERLREATIKRDALQTPETDT
jgi:hypothetical protein